ncbi:selenium-dependent molybdenum cofactor biosynthesis protein YqeB [Anoxynatronum buryatiense]|uniref:Xanthine dehydrogenase accessory factor n=1 Tax=Anoxynatronum buryatiense TaxID=489973 RepID=A0AA46AIM7_9CLOT|nr:selenium-dependent molybdenum cofactor biosynthesis protein YqeB [Anoxynatronum buryatiense]SMP51963.1 xanthine dehydrogenase accessory factor [Anoxynatronum buryatiense]
MENQLIVIRGGGDLASGVAHRLYQCGFRLLITEQQQPTVIRRTVAFANAVFENQMAVEGVTARYIRSLAEAPALWQQGVIPVMSAEAAEICRELSPAALVDATLAKKNTGVQRCMAPVVIGVGPGFTAGDDVDAVVESRRGHWLGRVIYEGSAQPNTGVPGIIAGVGSERVLRSPASGIFRAGAVIGDVVEAGQTVALVDGIPVTTAIGGLLRGLLADGLQVTPGFKVGDVDPRIYPEYCHQISDKARAIGGGVLEALLHLQWKRKG